MGEREMKETLLPCPFCGGEARMHPNNWLSCTLCNIFTDIHDTQSKALAHWNSRASPPAAPVAFDPLEGGCPHCRWLDTNLGRVLDKKCDLHQRIEDLHVSLDLEKQVRRNSDDMLRRVCEVIRADVDDNPVVVAQARMDEIRALEDEASQPAIWNVAHDGRLIDSVAAAIRGDGSDLCDGPWEALSDERKSGWRGDAVRAIAAVKEYLTTETLSAAPAAPTEAEKVNNELMRHHITVNTFECKKFAGEFRVEAFDDDGGCEVAIFAGPRARERAHSFAVKEYGTAERTEASDE